MQVAIQAIHGNNIITMAPRTESVAAAASCLCPMHEQYSFEVVEFVFVEVVEGLGDAALVGLYSSF